MFRTHLARLFAFSAATFLVGCTSPCNNGGCGSERPPLFSRFRTTSTSQPVVMSSGECCNGNVTGPYVPPMPPGTYVSPVPPGGTYVPPPPGQPVPRINDNGGKQMPYVPDNMSSRQGTKTVIQNPNPNPNQ
jgi:hypothetical protein